MKEGPEGCAPGDGSSKDYTSSLASYSALGLLPPRIWILSPSKFHRVYDQHDINVALLGQVSMD